MPAGEAVVVGEAAQSGHEYLELVGHERVDRFEVPKVLVLLVALGPVGEVEEHVEVGFVRVVERLEVRFVLRLLGQKAVSDDLLRVRRGERHLDAEARLDLGEVVGALGLHLADDVLHVLLRGDDDP